MYKPLVYKVSRTSRLILSLSFCQREGRGGEGGGGGGGGGGGELGSEASPWQRGGEGRASSTIKFMP